MTNSWDAYYEAFKTVFKHEEGEEAAIDGEHTLDIELSIEYEDKLIDLGYKELIPEEEDICIFGIELGRYLKLAEYGSIYISHEVPYSWTEFDFEGEEFIFTLKALELLGLKKEWVKNSPING